MAQLTSQLQRVPVGVMNLALPQRLARSDIVESGKIGRVSQLSVVDAMERCLVRILPHYRFGAAGGAGCEVTTTCNSLVRFISLQRSKRPRRNKGWVYAPRSKPSWSCDTRTKPVDGQRVSTLSRDVCNEQLRDGTHHTCKSTIR